jgi:hypothetical protein
MIIKIDENKFLTELNKKKRAGFFDDHISENKVIEILDQATVQEEEPKKTEECPRCGLKYLRGDTPITAGPFKLPEIPTEECEHSVGSKRVGMRFAKGYGCFECLTDKPPVSKRLTEEDFEHMSCKPNCPSNYHDKKEDHYECCHQEGKCYAESVKEDEPTDLWELTINGVLQHRAWCLVSSGLPCNCVIDLAAREEE